MPDFLSSSAERMLRSRFPAGGERSSCHEMIVRCREGRPPVPAAAASLASGAESTDYDAVLGGAVQRALHWERELARQRAAAAELWEELAGLAAEPFRLRVVADPRCRSWGFCAQLVEESRRLAPEDPERAADLAALALDLTGRLPAASHGEERLADLRALAWAAAAGARRLEVDLAGAGECLERARQALLAGTGDPHAEADLIVCEAALDFERGRFERAAGRLDRAIGIYRRLGDRHCEGAALVQKAEAVGQLDPDRAAALLRRALGRIDRGRDPRLDLTARIHLLWFLNDGGRPQQAVLLVANLRRACRLHGDAATALHLRWLEGRTARALGDLAAAEAALEEVWTSAAVPARGRRLGLLACDLAEVYLAAGKLDRALCLVHALTPLFARLGLRPEAWALCLLIRRAIARALVQR
jgi:tetratricopeptide (TPR) repeat protein